MGSVVYFNLFLLIFLTNSAVYAAKLNYPRVLLPIFQERSVNFTLEVIEKSCYKWISSRQDLISITSVYDGIGNECSHQATVTVRTRERRRNTAIVFAEEISTGETLRCDVILDIIDKLNVRTTTRQLYLEEAPETFELHAFDTQGNEFSTLEGIEFNWSIEVPNKGSSKITPALRFLSFTDSPYHDVPTSLESFEAQGITGYKVLLEGINTGTSKVSVSMPYAEYNNVEPIEVFISVLANLIIEPSEVHILAGDTIKFRLLQLKMGKLHEISLHNQYFFEVEDSVVAHMIGSSATGLRLGRTLISLRDRNVVNDDGLEKPKGLSAQLTVAEPEKLGVSLLPHNSWVTVVGERHEIAFDLYTSDRQKITLGTKYGIDSEIDPTLYSVIVKTKNGSRLYGETLKDGFTEVYGSYKDLSVQAELQIYDKLILTPEKVILPCDPNIMKHQQIQFRASGGDGNYIWKSGNPRQLLINNLGLATTIIRDALNLKAPVISDISEAGQLLLTSYANIKVALQKNPLITRQAEIYFLPPEKLEIKCFNFETALNDYVRIHVGIYAYVNDSYIPYTRCENVILDLEFSNQILQIDNNVKTETFAPEACQVLHLRSTSLGSTSLRVSYQFQNQVLHDTVNLNVFEPLSILKPIENEIVLPIGSSCNIIYINGPQRIYTLDAELAKITNYNSKQLKITEIEFNTKNSITAFTVLCRDFGETKLTYTVYNALTAKNFEPYKSEIEITVHCVRPRFLKLYATQELRSSCPLEMRSSLLHIKNNEGKFEIEIEVEDVHNRKLMNISSLWLEWEFAVGDERYHSDSIPHNVQHEVQNLYGVNLPGRNVLVTTLGEVISNFRIKGTVAHYNEKMLAKNDIYAERPPFGIKNPKTGEVTKPIIENEIRFMAVNSTLLPFEHISIFLSETYIERVPIVQGSSHYEFNLSEQGIVKVAYDAKQRILFIKPLRLGYVRIELIDLCLTNEPAHLSVSVVGIGSIDALAQDRVERTKTIDAIIRLYDTNENLLNINSYNLDIYELSETIFDTDIVSVKLGEQHNLDVGEIRYVITGHNVGETKIAFNAGKGDKQISSQPINIQVFGPIRLYPRNSTLVIGSSIQIYYQGGPKPDVNVVYSVQHKSIASINSAVVTAHQQGFTTVIGKCIMKNPISGKEEIISDDIVELHVVPLTSIQIRIPLTRIRSGAIMPVTLWGQPNLSPLILGTLENMQIVWESNQPDVVEIFNVFDAVGVEYGNTDMISMRVRALNPGKSIINVAVRLSDGLKLTAAAEILVFKTLELETPKHITMDWILMAPRSALQLKCNLDDVLYKLDSESSGIVSVTSDGLLHTKDTLGRDLIIAKTLDQTLPIGIEVKNIQYILASLVPTVKLKHMEHKIPRGMNLLLKVSLHDNLGNEFSHSIDDENGIKYELSTKDIIDVQIGSNLTIALNLLRETNNMIAISLKDTNGVKYSEDYIKLSVAESQHIYPTKTIFSVGDIICFDSPLTLSSIWTSSNEQVLSIDRHSGVARVHGSQYRLGDKIVVTNGQSVWSGYLKYDIEVRDADVIQLLKSFDIFSGLEYRAYLVIRNHMQTDKFTNLIAQNISRCINHIEKLPVKLFNCRLYSKQPLGIELLKHYKVSPLFEVSSGRYACQIDLVTNFNEVLGIVQTNDVNFELEVSMPNGLTNVTSLKFVPGVRVSPSTLEVTNLEEQELFVSGLDKVLQKVVVDPSNEKYIKMDVITKSFGLIRYRVAFPTEPPLTEQLYINVHSPETQQNIKIPIIGSRMLQQQCAQLPFGNLSYAFFKIAENLGLVITMLIILGITVYLYMGCYSTSVALEVNKEVFLNSPPVNSSLQYSPSGSFSSPYRNAPANVFPYEHGTPQASSAPSASSSPNNDSYIYGSPKIKPSSSMRRYI